MTSICSTHLSTWKYFGSIVRKGTLRRKKKGFWYDIWCCTFHSINVNWNEDAIVTQSVGCRQKCVYRKSCVYECVCFRDFPWLFERDKISCILNMSNTFKIRKPQQSTLFLSDKMWFYEYKFSLVHFGYFSKAASVFHDCGLILEIVFIHLWMRAMCLCINIQLCVVVHWMPFIYLRSVWTALTCKSHFKIFAHQYTSMKQ